MSLILSLSFSPIFLVSKNGITFCIDVPESKVMADTVRVGIAVSGNSPIIAYIILKEKIGQKRSKNAYFELKSAPIGMKFHTNMYSGGIY